MKALVYVAVLMFAFATGYYAFSQEAKPPAASKYTPTEVQSLRLQLAQSHAINAQQQQQTACGNGITPGTYAGQFSAALSSLNEEAAKVKKEQGWPETVEFNQATLAFAESKPPDAKKPDAKKDAKDAPKP